MDDKSCMQKTLHCIIEHCITCLNNVIKINEVNKNKVYAEVIKRRSFVSNEIKCIAFSVFYSKKTDEIAQICDSTRCLVESLILQDLLECALDVEVEPDLSISDDELHHLLYKHTMAALNPLYMKQMLPVPCYSTQLFEFSLVSHSNAPTLKSENEFLLSSQMDLSTLQFEVELSGFKSLLEPEANSNEDPKTKRISPKVTELSIESCRNSTSKFTESLEFQNESITNFWESLANSANDKCNLDFSLNSPVECTSISSWEGKMRQSVPIHLYTSELIGKEVQYNVTQEDSQMFRSLYDSSEIISEKDLVYDILNLLIGVPSNTFLYDKSKRKFEMRPHVHLDHMSHESTCRFTQKFIESGSMYYKLQKYAQSFHCDEGIVLKGMKDGIHQILTTYMEYIVTVKMNKPSLNVLISDILKNVELVNTLGAICGIQYQDDVYFELPKGLGLVSLFNESAWPFRSKWTSLMIAVLLKYTYSPYLDCLNKWISDGLCYDPYDEFQIAEDSKYLCRRDELYWKFAYTEIEDDPSRSIPHELHQFSQNIMECGKSMRFLRTCCPQLSSLEFLYCNPPPSLSMVFSYNAVIKKTRHCKSYVEFMAEYAENYKNNGLHVSLDEMYINKQLLRDQKDIHRHIHKAWMRVCVSEHSSVNHNEKLSSLKRTISQQNLVIEVDPNHLSGIIYKNIGILFSSCGYAATSLSHDPVMNFNYKKYYKEMNLMREFYKFKSSFPAHDIPGISKNSVNNFSFGLVSKNHFGHSVQSDSSLTMPKEDISDNILSDPFMNSLASLLVSEYGDSKEDIYSYLQLTSLQNLLIYNFKAVLSMRTRIIEKATMDYAMNHLNLQDLLLCLRNTYLLQDESFSQTLCENLFEWVFKCRTLDEFANWSALNEILCNSIAIPSLSHFLYLSSASASFTNIPEEDTMEGNDFLQFFHFEFPIEWPLNVFVHGACVAQYRNIFSILLQMEYLCWLLGKMWRTMIIDAKVLNIADSPQYREVMLNRFDMHQCIRIIRNCIHQEIGGPLWDFLLRSLSTEELSVDSLDGVHLQYLERALARCFLTQETTVLHDLVTVMFRQVFKFCDSGLEGKWELNSITDQYETDAFPALSSVYGTYKSYKKVFYERIIKMVATKKFGRSWDSEFQNFLEALLETGKNI